MSEFYDDIKSLKGEKEIVKELTDGELHEMFADERDAQIAIAKLPGLLDQLIKAIEKITAVEEDDDDDIVEILKPGDDVIVSGIPALNPGIMVGTVKVYPNGQLFINVAR